jgi:hypothetical protein
MKHWATDYFKIKLARQLKTADQVWNAVAGGLPYARGVRSSLEAHPELSQEGRERAGGGALRPIVGNIRSLPYAAAGGIGGTLLGAGLGHLTGGMMGHELAGAGLGAGLGGAAGGIGGMLYGGYNEGKNLTEEEISEMGKPEEEQRSVFERHPIASTLGVPLAVSGATKSLATAPLRTMGLAGARASLA